MSTTEPGYFEISRVDGLEAISLVDNSIDFLSTINKREVQSFRQWSRKRYGEELTGTHSELPFAEHGFSMLIRVLCGRKKDDILFDAGNSSDGVVENAKPRCRSQRLPERLRIGAHLRCGPGGGRCVIRT